MLPTADSGLVLMQHLQQLSQTFMNTDRVDWFNDKIQDSTVQIVLK